MEQLRFPFPAMPVHRHRLIDPSCSPALREQWSQRFSRVFGRPFRLRFHENRSTLVSSRERFGRLEIRLHQLFLDADDEVLRSLADFLAGKKRGGKVLDRFIESRKDRIARSDDARRSSRNGRGRVFDLERIRDALIRAYFPRPLPNVPITWGRPGRRRGSQVRLGSYSFEDGLIRIHPVFDQPGVPAVVVVSVVFHELLHCALGVEKSAGRRRYHTAEFHRREATYVHHDRAQAYLAQHLGQWLRRWRRDSTPNPKTRPGRARLEARLGG